jgi:transcriptional regulator with XRE-family HTH domain
MRRRRKNTGMDAQFGKRLRALRKQMKLSQTRLGKMAGVHYNHIGRYERGIALPSLVVIDRLARAFGVSVDTLINGPAPLPPAPEDEPSAAGTRADDECEETSPAAPSPAPASSRIASRLGRLMAAVPTLGPEDQAVAAAVIEALLLKSKIEDFTLGRR